MFVNNHPIHHLNKDGGESWLGLLDGVYAIAMTLIAIELPELIKSLYEASLKDTESGSFLNVVTIYEFVAYTATFLLLYEIWAYHKSIVRLGGIKRLAQNLINSVILALTCLGAGNIILILKAKTAVALEDFQRNVDQHQLFKDWVNVHLEMSLGTFVMVAVMFLLMSLLARYSRKDQPTGSTTATALRVLEIGTRWRAICFLGFVLYHWVPEIVTQGQSEPMVPAGMMILFYIMVNQILYPLIQSRRR
ncbi:MAG: TMEM175 family protein [Synechococcus sp.]